MPQTITYIWVEPEQFIGALDTMLKRVHPFYHAALKELRTEISRHGRDKTADELRELVRLRFRGLAWKKECTCGKMIYMISPVPRDNSGGKRARQARFTPYDDQC